METTNPYSNFLNNINSVEDLLSLYKELILEKKEINNIDEILRASIVLIVSAMDNYLHEFFRNEIVDGYLGDGNFDVKFENLKISISSMMLVDKSKNVEIKRNFLNQEIKKILSNDSYQSPKSIEYVFSSLSINNIWSVLSDFGIQDLTAKQIKDELANIIDRRNKISHESDWNIIENSKYPIDLPNVESVLNFILSFVEGINKIKIK